MSDRERIHNAMILLGQSGVYRPVSHDKDTDLLTVDEGSMVVPAQVLTNEIDATFETTQRRRRTRGRERQIWTWILILAFNEEVSLEEFEEEVSLNPTLLARDATHPRQVEFDLVSVNYIHPPRQAPENGTSATYTFNVRVSPV